MLGKFSWMESLVFSYIHVHECKIMSLPFISIGFYFRNPTIMNTLGFYLNNGTPLKNLQSFTKQVNVLCVLTYMHMYSVYAFILQFYGQK